ncbi:anti-sigma factor family protein [Streptomyces sp. NPDC048639]|uniref:anti-sigma factor family protein n=1 Tax=Streptomyces sp. NPDC048639 TaxID=3365581 RepID=UPI003722B78B
MNNRARPYDDDPARGGGMTCEELRNGLGTELALGILPAQERGAAIAHLDRCPGCREHIEQLTLAADGLLGLLPGSEPPVGFEKRVLGRLEVPGKRQRLQRRRHRLRLAAASAAIAAAFGFGGWAIGAATAGSPAPTASAPATQHGLLQADLTSDGQRVGEIFAHPGSPGWVYMSVALDGYGTSGYGQSPPTGKVTCQLVREDGTTTDVGTYTLKDGHGYWGGPAPVDADTVSGVRLVAEDGAVLATAHFDAAGR